MDDERAIKLSKSNETTVQEMVVLHNFHIELLS